MRKTVVPVRKRRKALAIGGIASVVFVFYFFFYIYTPASYIRAEAARLPEFPALQPSDRITVVAPHLDDEALGVGGLVAQAREKNIPVSIVFMTNGDGNRCGVDLQFKTVRPTSDEYIASGRMRQDEALRSVQALGVDKENAYFLGLPDQGLASLYTPEFASAPYTSNFTHQDHSPYGSSYIPNLPYTRDSARQALSRVLNETNPTLVFAPLIEDHHKDHAATGMFVKDVLPKAVSHPRAYTYLVHFPKYPVPRGVDPSLPLVPPQRLSSKHWESIPLDPYAEQKKAEAVSAHASQLRIPEVAQLLKGLVRTNEIVAEGF
jgi:LmbE family N-acetylglucosaminyl deacetylase